MKKRYRYLCLIVLASMFEFCCAGEKREASTVAAASTRSSPEQEQASSEIKFVMHLDGTMPPMPMIKMNADRKCLAMHKEPVYSQRVIINGSGMLENVFVYVKEGLGSRTFPAPKTPVVLEQHECMYEPHVLGIMTGQPLEIINRDPVLHNIHALPKTNRPFNVAQPRQGMSTVKSFSHVEVMVPVKCEVHSWMNAYIGVLDHPFFAVSDSDGACEIKGLPPGSYLISAWHEKFGFQAHSVTLASGETKNVEFRFSSH